MGVYLGSGIAHGLTRWAMLAGAGAAYEHKENNMLIGTCVKC